MASLGPKYSGSKIALHSDLRARAGPGEVIIEMNRSRRAKNLRLETSPPSVGPTVEQRNSLVTHLMTAAPRHHRHVATGCASAHTTLAQLPGINLRAVQIRITKCDSRLRSDTVSPAESEIGIKINSSDSSANPPSATASFHSPIAPATVSTSTTSSPYVIATTGIRILQLNMQHSVTVAGEVRQFVASKHLEVLLLQEPYVRMLGTSHTVTGLGIETRVTAISSHFPWTAVAVCNPRFEMIFVSQLSIEHCVCAKVLAPGFSVYAASCYFQYSDEIEEHLRHLEMVFHSL